MLSVDQLVPLPVIGEEDEVVVGELHAGTGRLHVIAPGHRLIVAVTDQGASRAPGVRPGRPNERPPSITRRDFDTGDANAWQNLPRCDSRRAREWDALDDRCT